MTTVSIIGSGNMGTAIAGIVAAGGNTAEFIGRDTADTINGDIVVLAVPHPALDEIVATRGDQLAGKIVVDITNPLNFETFDSLVAPADGSRTSELAKALPNSRVLKAFNTNFAATLASKTAGGLAAVDAGALSRARELESVGFLQLTLAVQEKVGWTGGFAVAA
jgi:8-hydroxy-5-deazaflavin:NADPH oxidoreductase